MLTIAHDASKIVGEELTTVDMKQIRLDEGVHEALRQYAVDNGGHVKGLASVAIAEFLQSKGVDVRYPNPGVRQSA